MREAAQSTRQTQATTRRTTVGTSADKPTARFAPSAMQALALQRLAGNRAASRILARWANHPDKDKKGAMVPDSVAADLLRFSPPQNK